jgi:phage baseplate assembly protein W
MAAQNDTIGLRHAIRIRLDITARGKRRHLRPYGCERGPLRTTPP